MAAIPHSGDTSARRHPPGGALVTRNAVAANLLNKPDGRESAANSDGTKG
jgi:hypothetical protein